MKLSLLTTALILLSGCAGLGDEYVSDANQYTSGTTTTLPTSETTPTSSTTTTYTDPNDIDDDGDGYSENQGDCDDTNADLSPDTIWYADYDSDGFTGDNYILQCEEPTGTYDRNNNGDCNDTDPLTYPGAIERCDGEDNDCQGDGEAAGIVTLIDIGNNETDVTSLFTGTAFFPQSLNLGADGSYNFCDGTYYVNLNILANVELKGMSGTVILDGGGVNQVIQATDSGSYTVNIENLTIQNGSAQYGGGMHFAYGGELTLIDVTFKDNYAYWGGALSLEYTSAVLAGVSFQSNSAEALGAIWSAYGTISATETEFYANTTSGEGSAIGLEYTDFTCTDCSVKNNESSSVMGGGAIALAENSSISLTNTSLGLESSAFDDNMPRDITIFSNVSPYPILNYNYEDNTTVACDNSGCGTDSTYTIISSSPWGQGASPDLFMGNTFLANDITTLDRFSYHVQPLQTCTPNFYVYESLDGANWTQIYSAPGEIASSASYSDVYSGNIGLAVTNGKYYFLGIHLPYNMCNSFYFYKGTGVGSGYTGFGNHVGSVTQSSWLPNTNFSHTFGTSVITGTVQVSH